MFCTMLKAKLHNARVTESDRDYEGSLKIDRDLMELVPRDQWADFAHLLIFHGRYCCTARKPDCPDCPVTSLCPSAFTFEGK